MNTATTIEVTLTVDDMRLLLAFVAWDAEHPTRSPKRKYIEYGYGDHKFPRNDRSGPRTFDRLKAIGAIKHSQNGHSWLTDLGRSALKELP